MEVGSHLEVEDHMPMAGGAIGLTLIIAQQARVQLCKSQRVLRVHLNTQTNYEALVQLKDVFQLSKRTGKGMGLCVCVDRMWLGKKLKGYIWSMGLIFSTPGIKLKMYHKTAKGYIL